MKRKPYESVQIDEGKWYAVGTYDHHECCDCGLVHREEFKLERGRLFWRVFRDDRQTRINRRALGITVSRETPPPHKGR